MCVRRPADEGVLGKGAVHEQAAALVAAHYVERRQRHDIKAPGRAKAKPAWPPGALERALEVAQRV